MRRLLPLLSLAALGCASAPAPHGAHTAHGGHPPHVHTSHTAHPPHAPAEGDAALAAVAAVHGGSGPFAVAGYRIGTRALRDLGLPRGSFDVEVVHTSPGEVQWSCIADGVAAATGASVGRLTLRRVDSPDGSTHTLVRNRATGATVRYTLTEGFVQRFRDTPRPQLDAQGRTVLDLPESEVLQPAPDAR